MLEILPLDAFYKENEKLIHFAARKALSRFEAAHMTQHVTYEDIVGSLTELFVRSYNLMDWERSKFSTYFMTVSQNHISNMLKSISSSVEFRADSVQMIADRLDNEDDNASDIADSLLSYAPEFEDMYELMSEVKAIRNDLSPFAQILLNYTINPPEFIEDEFNAQRANTAFARSVGERSFNSTKLNLQFIANCLIATVDDPQQVKSIKKAVEEVRQVVGDSIKRDY